MKTQPPPRAFCATLLLFLSGSLPGALPAASTHATRHSATPADAWKTVWTSPDLTIAERRRADSGRPAFRAVGLFEAAPERVRRVLDDVSAFPSFMPYVVEARVLADRAGERILYQRLAPPLVAERDYTLRLRWETRREAGHGSVYIQHWETANAMGPPPRAGIIRVELAEGFWRLEPAGHGRTRATYQSHTDPGGALPAVVANVAGKESIRKLFAAIRRQVRLAKYAQ